MEKLTTQEYWEDYYRNENKPERNQVIAVCSPFDKFWDILINKNDANPPKTIIEIGGYPGRYLAYLANRYNLIPTSLDYNSDSEKIKENMQIFGVKDYFVIQEDFFVHEPKEIYDIVISNGFVEHFENFEIVFDNHLKYLKKGGTLLITIPNMKYYIKYYKWLVDKRNLDIHNLKSMNLDNFRKFANRNNLQTLNLQYIGGFPFSVHQKLNFMQKIIFQTHRVLFKKMLNKRINEKPNKYFSASIVAIYKS